MLKNTGCSYLLSLCKSYYVISFYKGITVLFKILCLQYTIEDSLVNNLSYDSVRVSVSHRRHKESR